VRDERNIKALEAVYSDTDELLADISNAYRDLILALYEAGARDVKLDDCTWGVLVDESFWQGPGSEIFDREDLQSKFLKLNNDALVDLPADLRVSTHVCRGNFHSTWASSGGYAPVAKDLFGKENVDAFYLEFDDDRSGDFAPLAEVPAGK